jgi:hypothetical protein
MYLEFRENIRLFDSPRFGSSNGTDVLRFGFRRIFKEIRYHLIIEPKAATDARNERLSDPKSNPS